MWTDTNRARYNRDHLRYPSDLTDAEWGQIASPCRAVRVCRSVDVCTLWLSLRQPR